MFDVESLKYNNQGSRINSVIVKNYIYVLEVSSNTFDDSLLSDIQT